MSNELFKHFSLFWVDIAEMPIHFEILHIHSEEFMTLAKKITLASISEIEKKDIVSSLFCSCFPFSLLNTKL